MNGLTLLVVGLAAGVAVGTTLEPGLLGGHDHGDMQVGDAPYEVMSDDRKIAWPADLPKPTVDVDLQKDPASGYNLILTTTNFRMTPEDVNEAVEPGTGHGHLFVNGVNQGRLYANMRHMTNLEPGEVTIHIAMGANDHRIWIVDGEALFVERTFTVE